MFTVTETVRIDRPIEDVFAFVADSRNRSLWDTTVISERLTSPGPLTVGSTLHSRLKAMGRDVDFDWRVTHFDPPTRMRITSTAGPLPTTFTLDVSKSGALSELRATIDASPGGLIRLVEPMVADAARTNLSAGLRRLKGLLEAGS